MPAHTRHYPILSLLDRAIDLPFMRFADDPAAPLLECRARELIAACADYWSDPSWQIGLLSEADLDRMRETLERERAFLSDVGMLGPVADQVAFPPSYDRIAVDELLDRVA